MPRKPDERIIKAKELYKKGQKLIEIANRLDVPEGTVRSWKNRNGIATLQKKNATLRKQKEVASRGIETQLDHQEIKTQKSMVSSRSIFQKKPFLLSRTSRRKILLIFSGKIYRLLMQPS